MDVRDTLRELGPEDFGDDAFERSRAVFMSGVVPATARADAVAGASGPDASGPPPVRWRFGMPRLAVMVSVVLVLAVVGAVVATALWLPRGGGLIAATPTPTRPPTNGWQPTGDYSCGGAAVPAAALADPTWASELDEAGREMLAEAAPELPDPAAWIVVREAADRLTLIAASALDPQYADIAHPLDVALLTVVPGDEVSDDEVDWIIQLGTCSLTRDIAGIDILPVEVAPNPDPAAAELRLIVSDGSCGSKLTAEGIEVVEVTEMPTTVGFLVGVPGPRSAVFCAALYARRVPITIPLDAPLGDRAVVDLARASADDVFGAGAARLPLQSPTTVSAPEPSADAGAVTCRGAVIPGSALEHPTRVSTLGDTRYRFEEAGIAWADDDSWNVVEDTPERVRLLHVLGEDSAELYEIGRVMVFGGYTLQWEPTDMGACTLTPVSG